MLKPPYNIDYFVLITNCNFNSKTKISSEVFWVLFLVYVIGCMIHHNAIKSISRKRILFSKVDSWSEYIIIILLLYLVYILADLVSFSYNLNVNVSDRLYFRFKQFNVLTTELAMQYPICAHCYLSYVGIT